MSIRSVAFYNSRTLGFNIPACDEPPDPDPGPDLNHDDTNNNDDSHVINNEDEDINERNCETPARHLRGFGDRLENESEDILHELLDVD